MTDDVMILRSLVEKSADVDLLREMIGFVAEKLMEIEVGAATGSAYGEKRRCQSSNCGPKCKPKFVLRCRLPGARSSSRST